MSELCVKTSKISKLCIVYRGWFASMCVISARGGVFRHHQRKNSHSHFFLEMCANICWLGKNKLWIVFILEFAEAGYTLCMVRENIKIIKLCIVYRGWFASMHAISPRGGNFAHYQRKNLQSHFFWKCMLNLLTGKEQIVNSVYTQVCWWFTVCPFICELCAWRIQVTNHT